MVNEKVKEFLVSRNLGDRLTEHAETILSGFYGVLKPMDGVTPYRLEMQAGACIGMIFPAKLILFLKGLKYERSLFCRGMFLVRYTYL